MSFSRHVILDNVRSSHNVGSVFRTCDGAGVEAVHLCGYTPTPIDRFGRQQKEISKVALGAEKTLPWHTYDTTADALQELKKNGVRIVGVEQTSQAKSYANYTPKGNVAFVFGNEREGISEEVLSLCDEIIEIPMNGNKESLNVSVTVGIILFACR